MKCRTVSISKQNIFVEPQHKMYWNLIITDENHHAKALNHNIRCIEMCIFNAFCIIINIVEPQHKMYWNFLYIALPNSLVLLNHNIRCIEMLVYLALILVHHLLNHNIRCIEIFLGVYTFKGVILLNHNIRCIEICSNERKSGADCSWTTT